MNKIYEKAEEKYAESQIREFPREFEYFGRKFVLQKGVFPPDVFLGSRIYTPHLPLNEGDVFLDMGCGCGVVGITACIEKNLSKVLCADVSEEAVQNTLENVERYNLQDKISVLKSDIFTNIGEDEKFDLVFWNAPYFDAKPSGDKGFGEMSYDENYVALKKFIAGADKRLKHGGKIMTGISSSRVPLENIAKKAKEIGFGMKIFFQGRDPNGFSQELLEFKKEGGR